MMINNVKRNFAGAFSDFLNDYPLKAAPMRFAKRKLARMVRDAKRDFLSGFGIDWSQYDEPVLELFDETIGTLTWTHKVSGQSIVLSAIWWDDKTGEIMQAGSNYGDLTL